MADFFFTHFSRVLDVGPRDNAARAFANATRKARIAWWRAVNAAA